MTEAAGSESPTPNDGAVDRVASGPVAHRIDPHAALPEHLQAMDFDQDIWGRIRRHPIRNPALTRNKLDEDPESRELVRQIMGAANEREKEVLLHNQARVFQEVLGRVLDQVWAFLDRPLVPQRWVEPAARLPHHAADDVARSAEPPTASDAAKAVPRPLKTRPSRGWGRLVATLLTPKYILLILSAFFLFATGYSQLQVKNLKDSIASYKMAADASEELKEQLAEAVASAKSDRERLTSQLDGRVLELAQVRNGLREEELKAAGLHEQLRLAEEREKKTASELKQYREQQADDIKVVQGKVDELQSNLLTSQTSLATATARVKSLEDSTASLRRTNSEQQRQLRAKTTEYEALAQANSSLLNRVSALQQDQALLGFAETCIDNIRRAESWGNFNDDKVRQYLQEYKSARKNLGFQ